MNDRPPRAKCGELTEQRALDAIERQRRKQRRGWTVQVYEDQLAFARGLRNALLLNIVLGGLVFSAFHLLRSR